MAQADGYQPRLNAAMVQSGKFAGMIVSAAGRIQHLNNADQTMQFKCSDGGILNMDISGCELELEKINENIALEAIGQLDENGFTVSGRILFWTDLVTQACHCSTVLVSFVSPQTI